MTAPASVPLRIDFVSDVVCPWCAIGLASLEQALQRLDGEVAAEIHFQPFELNPQLPPEGEDIAGHLQRKYGMDEAQLAQNQERIRQRGAELGVVFDLGARSRIYYTFDAHRLLHQAGLEGRAFELLRALLEAYHVRGENLARHEVLAAAAAEAGLDPAQARAVLDSDAHAEEVRAAVRHWQQLGINGVPAVVIDQRLLISGAQPAATYERALRSLAAQDPGPQA